MSRKIKDTDIVYSAVEDRKKGGVVRMALQPALDSLPYSHPTQLPCRAVWGWPGDDTVRYSCRSHGRSPDVMRWEYAPGDDDDWLDWLAEGEPGRGDS